ncbi:MAG: lipopolysaccharide biosynthesis glycosyltransferase [bacterium]|nr:MAG: lipopolysaccharide biosynthesis glycosyltransferase [bacterium]
MPISVTIITCNEETNISAALESVKWASEIIVVDSESSDNTVTIACQFTDKVIIKPWLGFALQKQFAAEQATGDWILSIDADERVTPTLAEEIKKVIKDSNNQYDGFYISRQNYYLNKAIYHSGWAPDYQLRLYKKGKGQWEGNFVHESVTLNGKVGKLQAKLDHYSIQSLAAHHKRLNRYTTLAANQLCSRGKQAKTIDLLVRPIMAIFRSYVWRLGILDGFAGIIIAYFAAYYVFLKYAKAWEIRQKRG